MASWWPPIWIAVSVFLAALAIYTALHSPSSIYSPAPTRPISYQLILNASMALRRSGQFNIIATLLLLSPETFISTPNLTIFAIKDSALTANSSHPPPWLLKPLLQYHTSPLRLSMNDLLKKRRGSCLPTLLPQKNVVLTKTDAKKRLVEINHVVVSHPDIYLAGNLTIHGVLGPFALLGFQDFQGGFDSIQAPICDANSSLALDDSEPKNLVQWSRIIRLLSSNGFVSFAVGLNAVLDGILQDYRDLESVTVFTPPEFAFVASPSSMLDRIVRFHMLPRKVTYVELASLPDKASLRTLLLDRDLEITGGFNVTRGLARGLAINGVEIVAPEIFSSEKFIVHGISRAFEMVELPSISR